jgi:ribosomal protein L9
MEKAKEQEKAAVLLKEAENKKIHQAINNQQFFFTLKKGENNQIFGSVRAEDFLNEVKKLGFPFEKKQLLDFTSLSNLGDN